MTQSRSQPRPNSLHRPLRRSLVAHAACLAAITAAASFAAGSAEALAAQSGDAAASASGSGSALDAALALVPADAIAFVVVPSPKRASDDLQQCIERMNRPEASLGGRPIDQLKAQLGISASFDDKGPLAISVRPPLAEGTQPRLVVSVPATDPKAFVEGNFIAAPDVAPDAYKRQDGTILYASLGAKHAHLSLDAEAVRGFDAGTGIATAARARLGARGSALLAKGDVVSWASRGAIQPALAQAAAEANRQTPSDAPFASQAKELQATSMKLLEGLNDGLLVLDFDPLGVGVRSYATFAEGSELAVLAAGGTDREVRFDKLPKQPFYFATRVDIDGLGGIAALESLLAKLPGQPGLPSWLAGAKDAVRAIQMAIYPSKMGIAVGGLLNDSILFLETDKPDVVRDGLRDAIMAMKGEVGGLRREPTWERDKTLKSGETTDAFEVAETVVAAKDASPADLSMQRMITQGIYGSRGLVGFVKRQPKGVVMTFSQRSDVLDRATKVSAGGASLADDATIGAYREWLIDRPEIGRADVEGFIGVGQFGKLFQQLLTLVPGGDQMQAQVPQIPTSVEPIAFALEVDKGTVEGALVIPSGVLAIGFDQIKRQLTGAAAPAPAAAPAAKDTP